MGRTIPSFRITLQTEKAEWKPFRNALKKEREEFDDMFDIPRSYLTACSNAVSPVLLQRIIIIISILSHYYKELTELKVQVEHMKGEKQPKEVLGEKYTLNAGTLDRCFVVNNKMKQLT